MRALQALAYIVVILLGLIVLAWIYNLSEPHYTRYTERTTALDAQWSSRESKDPITDEPYLLAAIQGVTLEGTSRLTLNCTAGRVWVHVWKSTYLGVGDATVEVRFDELPPRSYTWKILSEGKGLGGYLASEQAQQFAQSSTLLLRITPQYMSSFAVRINTTGFQENVPLAPQYCNTPA